VTGKGVASGSYVNYATGAVVLKSTGNNGGQPITANFGYYPTLPVMGISQREVAGVDEDQTVIFDTKYAYIWDAGSMGFQEFIPGTTWDGTNSDFFLTTNYRGVEPQNRLFFATNFVNDVGSAMRYTDGSTWTNFAPTIAGPPLNPVSYLTQARILIPYFGRLLAFNVWESPDNGSGAPDYGAGVNIFNRCRFSAIGNPIATNAWRSDIFGQGGIIDAPTNEQIISATFLNNTLIVAFENTTWQLRYVGEYGLPFIWERIASDLGSVSTFSPVLFNDHILAIGDKAIVAQTTNRVERIDLNIPDQIFDFQTVENNALYRVQGIRDYQKELVFWSFVYAEEDADDAGDLAIFPNRVLVYNYRNQTWAIFRDNVTAFGLFQTNNNITWGSQTILWGDPKVLWGDIDDQTYFPFIISGNQEGFIHKYGYTFPDEASLSITGISFNATTGVTTLTINNHNLADGDIIYVTNLQFIDSTLFTPVATNLNNQLYSVYNTGLNTVEILLWDFVGQNYFNNVVFTPANLNGVTYIGGGQAALMPQLSVQTKDFNPFQQKGLQLKLSHIDFLTDVENPDSSEFGTITNASNTNPCVITSANHGLSSGQQITIQNVQGMTQLNVGAAYTITVLSANTFALDNTNAIPFGIYTSNGNWTLVLAGLSVEIFMNSSSNISGNLISGNNKLNLYGTNPFYNTTGDTSQYEWHRFYATCAGQYMNLLLTYDLNLMNVYATHRKDWVLNAINLFVRTAGKIVF
jgi:hypothetical protein